MDIGLTVWILAGLFVSTVAHEATHWLLAHRRGLRLVRVRLSPMGVGLTFPTLPATHYLVFQLVTPVLVTWIVLFGWLAVPQGGDAISAFGLARQAESYVLMITVVAMTMSVGDLQELLRHLAHRRGQDPHEAICATEVTTGAAQPGH